MMARLAGALQFPLLYMVLVVTGLTVYGSDFESGIGYVYLAPFVVGPLMVRTVRRRFGGLVGELGAALLVFGAVGSGALFRTLEIDYWDEHSLDQAVAICALGFFSLLAYALTTRKADSEPPVGDLDLALALVVLGLPYLISYRSPLFGVVGTGLALILAASWLVREPRAGTTRYGGGAPSPATARGGDPAAVGEPVDRPPSAAPRPARFSSAVVFLATFDLGAIIWDANFDTGWALHWWLGLTAAGLAAVAVGRLGGVSAPILAAWGVSFAVVVPSADWGIHPIHAVLAGLALGWALRRGAPTLRGLDRIALMCFLGLGLSVAQASQADYRWVRLILAAISLAPPLVVGRWWPERPAHRTTVEEQARAGPTSPAAA